MDLTQFDIDATLDLGAYFKDVVIPNLKEMDQEFKTNSKLRSFHPLYERSCNQADEIRPHAEAEHFPEKLFKNLNPHQRDDEFMWMKKNYEAHTIPVFVDFMNTIKRGINRQNYRITFGEDSETALKEESFTRYCTKGLPEYGSIHTWFSNTLFDSKLKDANAVLAVRPYSVEFLINEDGEITRDTEQDYEPVPVIYESKQVLSFVEKDHLLAMAPEKSIVTFGNGKVREGYVFYLYTKNVIYRIWQTGKKIDYTFDVMEWFIHEAEELPCWKMKGLPKMIESTVYYQSPYFFAVGNLNTMLKNKTVLEMSTVNTAFPYRIMMVDECDQLGDDGNRCHNGSIMRDNKLAECPACKGTGLKDKPSAGGTLLVNEAEAEGSNSLDRIRFVAPDTAILEYLKTKAREEESAARAILHLKTTTDQATGDLTATGRQLDMKSVYAFMMPILDEGFDLLENVLDAMAYQRYGDAAPDPNVMRPVDLDFKTSTDYLQDYKDAIASGAPPMVIIRFMEKYIKSLFYGSDQEEEIWQMVLAADTLASFSNDEVRAMKGAQMIQPWQAILHVSIFSYIQEMINSDETFLEKETPEQVRMLQDRAKADAALQTANRSALAFTPPTLE